MRSFPAICWWALAIIFFIESVKSTSNTDVGETNHRLPNESYPEHYNIELTTNVHLGDKAFQGKVTIDIVVERNTSKIVLHAGPFKISKATIENSKTGKSEDLAVDYELKREFLTLTRKTSEQFSPKTNWKLTIIYRGDLSDDRSGFFITKYKDDDGKYHYLATTGFRPSDARRAFPCYDEVNKRANFTITINHSPTYTAISNMPVNAELSSANRTVFLTTPPMATYLVAFAVSDFEYTEDEHNDFPLRIYSSPNIKNLHEKVLPIISNFVKNVSDYTDVPYMLPKMDIVIIPNYGLSCMESWGLLMFNESIFVPELIKFDLSYSYYHLLRIGLTIASQWFDNYVTFSSFAYIWLTTTIGDLYALNAIDSMYPNWNVWDIDYNNYYSEILDKDSADQPLSYLHYENKTPSKIMKSYYPDIYPKSNFMMHMWINALTDKIYRKGLNKFLQKNQYGLFGEQDLFDALQSAVEEENYEIPAAINDMISTWTYQSGYPILTVTRNYSDGTFTIKQETFYSNETMKDSKTRYVPFNYAVASNPNFNDTTVTHYLRNVTETNFTDVKIPNNDWLILNKQSIGYYRVNYDITNWNLIIKALIENPFQISNRNRAQLLRDAFALWKSNRLDVSVLLNLFSYLKKENDFLCWNTFYKVFLEMEPILRSYKKFDDFQFFVAELINPIFEKLRLVNESSDNYFQSKVRLNINSLADYVNINKLLEDKFINLKNHLKENKTLTKDVLNCNAMKIADEETFNTLYQMLIDKENKIYKIYLIEALSCSGNINLLKKLMRSSIDKTIDLHNYLRIYILQACRNSQIYLPAGIEFLDENFEAVYNLGVTYEKYNGLELVLNIWAMTAYNNDIADKVLALAKKINNKYVGLDVESEVKSNISSSLKTSKKYVEQIMPWVTEYRERATQGTNSSRQSLLRYGF